MPQIITGNGTVNDIEVTATSRIPDEVQLDNPDTAENEATVRLSHQVDINSGSTGKINIAIVIDRTVSTNNSAGFDVDGDGNIDGDDSILLAEKMAAKQIFQSYLDAGYDPADITISLVSFTGGNEGDTDQGYWNHGTFSADGTGQAAFNGAVDGITSDYGQTNFEAGLNGVNAVWSDLGANVTDTNHVIFLTDGESFGGDLAAGRTLIETSFGASIHAYGIGDASANFQGTLDAIDNTGGALIIATGDDLAELGTIANSPQLELDSIEVIFEYEDINGENQTLTFDILPGDPRITATAAGHVLTGDFALSPPAQMDQGQH